MMVISPQIWLRPNVDNLLKFYANGFNAEYPEADVMLSPTGGSNISDFTETITNIVDGQLYGMNTVII